MVKTFLSYFFPVRLRKYQSALSGTLEVNLVNGKKVLDTKNTNYSYGLLQKLLHQGLEQIGFNQDVKSILVLGMGGGSVVPTVREDFKSDAFMELVEIDPEMVAIAKSEFQLDRFSNIHITEADAADFMRNNQQLFDVIVVDVFVVNTIPKVFTQPEFLLNLVRSVTPGGNIIYNTLRKTMAAETRKFLADFFTDQGLQVRIMEKVMWSNDLVLACKPMPQKDGPARS